MSFPFGRKKRDFFEDFEFISETTSIPKEGGVTNSEKILFQHSLPYEVLCRVLNFQLGSTVRGLCRPEDRSKIINQRF